MHTCTIIFFKSCFLYFFVDIDMYQLESVTSKESVNRISHCAFSIVRIEEYFKWNLFSCPLADLS